MKLAWHIIRKDFFRLRWILTLWAVVLAAALGLATIQSGLDAETYYPFWVVASIVVRGFLPLFAFGLVMGLLHDDSVAEIDAFWITRPISGGELLLAKALMLVMIVLLPAVVMLPFWLAHGFSASQVVKATGDVWLGHFLIAVAALPFALVSANGSKFVLNVMFGTGGLLLVTLGLQVGSPRTWTGDPGVVHAKSWLIAWLWIAVSFLMVLNQFFGRRTRWSVAALVVALVAGLVVSVWWSRPLAFLARTPKVHATALMQDAPTLTVNIDGQPRPTAIVAQVPLRDGASASRRGNTLKVQSVFLDYTGELQVSFSETVPQPARGLTDRLPHAPMPLRESVHYLLLNPKDGVILPVKTEPAGNGLEMATMRFRHAGIRMRPFGSWQGTPPPNLKTWLQGAWLVKVIATETVQTAGGNL